MYNTSYAQRRGEYFSGVFLLCVCMYVQKQSSMLSEATHFMTELVGSYDADKLCAASLHLAGIIKKGRE